MKTGKTLQELAIEIERQRDAKRDYIAPTSKMEMVGLGRVRLGGAPSDLPLATVVPLAPQAAPQGMAMNSLAHGQLAEYTGIPKPYYDRMLAEDPDLLAGNVNTWLHKKSESRMVRTLDGRVRAILSDRYRPMENADLAEAVLPVLLEQDLFVVSCEITERRMYIKAFDRRIEREIKFKGTDAAHTFLKDVVFPAITISNSEVGSGALQIAAGLYTGGCTNFAAFSDSRMRKYHVGGKAADSSEVYAMYTDATKRLTDAALWAQTRDVVKSAFDLARFEELVGRVQETAQQPIDGDVVKVIDLTGEKFGFSKDEKSSILRHLISGGDLSRYGLFNAVTRAAEDLPDYERASEFERIGGRVIELPQSEWKVLAKAA